MGNSDVVFRGKNKIKNKLVSCPTLFEVDSTVLMSNTSRVYIKMLQSGISET